jgi:hypothetical protein
MMKQITAILTLYIIAFRRNVDDYNNVRFILITVTGTTKVKTGTLVYRNNNRLLLDTITGGSLQ